MYYTLFCLGKSKYLSLNWWPTKDSTHFRWYVHILKLALRCTNILCDSSLVHHALSRQLSFQSFFFFNINISSLHCLNHLGSKSLCCDLVWRGYLAKLCDVQGWDPESFGKAELAEGSGVFLGTHAHVLTVKRPHALATLDACLVENDIWELDRLFGVDLLGAGGAPLVSQGGLQTLLLKSLTFLLSFNVFWGDYSSVVVDRELYWIEISFVANIAKELLVMLIQCGRSQPNGTVDALQTGLVIRFPVGANHLFCLINTCFA